MTASELEKIKRLEETFELNYKLTRLYATYLECYPDLITEKIVKELTGDGEMSEESALIALLCHVFDIDYGRSAKDRRLYRDYVSRSVRILDPKKYTENPYYKNIRINDLKDGDWEFKTESYPAYRGVICEDMIVEGDLTEIPPLGFFKEEFVFPAVLEGGNEWMTLTPVDLDTCEEAINAARGKVITFGLGLGYYAYMCQRKPEVESITVIEKSEKVIELFKKHILPQFEKPEKVIIINADAFEFAEREMPMENYDLAFVDTWRDASDGAPMYKRMKPLEKLSPNTRFMYWIESFIVSRIRSERIGELIDGAKAGKTGYPKSYDELCHILKNPLL